MSTEKSGTHLSSGAVWFVHCPSHLWRRPTWCHPAEWQTRFWLCFAPSAWGEDRCRLKEEEDSTSLVKFGDTGSTSWTWGRVEQRPRFSSGCSRGFVYLSSGRLRRHGRECDRKSYFVVTCQSFLTTEGAVARVFLRMCGTNNTGIYKRIWWYVEKRQKLKLIIYEKFNQFIENTREIQGFSSRWPVSQDKAMHSVCVAYMFNRNSFSGLDQLDQRQRWKETWNQNINILKLFQMHIFMHNTGCHLHIREKPIFSVCYALITSPAVSCMFPNWLWRHWNDAFM